MSLQWRFNSSASKRHNDDMDRALLHERARSRDREARVRAFMPDAASASDELDQEDFGDRIVIDM